VSGFIGLLGRRGAPVDPAQLGRLAARLGAHARDGTATWCRDGIGLAQGRLDTGDALSDARGVMESRSGRLHVVGDIRLDARDALRAGIGAAGTGLGLDATDGALVLAAWECWGAAALSRLRGEFSFAVWDARARALWCVRDSFGVRPLWYADVGDAFVCGNVLDAVRAHPAVSSRIDDGAVVSFLQHGFNTDLTSTTFADVRRLAPAHAVRVAADGAPGALSAFRHWTFPVPPPLVLRDDAEYVEAYRDVLGRAVGERLRGGRAGILLSGGLDSTSIAATARRVAPETDLKGWTTAVSALVPDGDTPLAVEVAHRLGIRHEIVDDIPVPLEHLGVATMRTAEPFDEPELATWFRLTSRLAGDSAVAVMGEDGDALFSPPSITRAMRTWPVLDVLGRAVRYTIAHRRLPHIGLWLRRRVRRAIHGLSHGPGRSAPSWLRPAAASRVHVPEPVASAAGHATRPLAHQFLTGPVWQSLLESCDAGFTRAPVEFRWPLLDTRVLEFALAIPPVPWCQRKEIVRAAFRADLPVSVTARRKQTLSGYDEAQVALWRRETGTRSLALCDRTREYVDVDAASRAVASDDPFEVARAWRVWELDRWFRDAARGAA
jgi:asparagine synthase (glutamine-hydrolysing)